MQAVDYRKIWRIICSASFFVLQSYAYFENVTVWRHNETGQLIYGVADRHEGAPENQGATSMGNYGSKCYLNYLFHTYARQKKQHEFLVIAEDPHDYSGTNSSITKLIEDIRYTLAQDDEYYRSPLIGLNQLLQDKGFTTVNAEYRFARAYGLFPIRENFPVDSNGEYPSLLPISGRDIVQEYEQVTDEIAHYTEQPLQDYYRTTLARIHAVAHTTLARIQRDSTDIIQYINKNIPAEQREPFCSALSLFDVQLVDARIVHHIISNPSVKKIVFFCGSFHKCSVGQLLQNLPQYKEIAHVGDRNMYSRPIISFDPPNMTLLDSIFNYPDCLLENETALIGHDNPEQFISNHLA